MTVSLAQDMVALEALPLALREAIRYSPDKYSAEQLLLEFNRGKALRPDLSEKTIISVYCQALLQGVPERDKGKA